MRHKPDNFASEAADRGANNTAPLDWAELGNRIHRAALTATTLHLIQTRLTCESGFSHQRTARSRPDDGAAVETPRVPSGG